jgi:hypothetical protein
MLADYWQTQGIGVVIDPTVSEATQVYVTQYVC